MHKPSIALTGALCKTRFRDVTVTATVRQYQEQFITINRQRSCVNFDSPITVIAGEIS